MPAISKPVTLALGPASRGAPDDLRSLVMAAAAGAGGRTYVLSQQLSDRPLVDRLLETAAAPDSEVRVLVEYSYLAERSPDRAADPWAAHGRNEAARQAFMALARSAVPVRADYVGASLLHSNFLVQSRPGAAASSVTLTSANLTAGGLDHHLNALVTIEDAALAQTFAGVFADAWGGDFRAASGAAGVGLDGGGTADVVIGAGGVTVAALAERIAAARRSIELAVFTVAAASALVAALTAALDRGVSVRGVVDADQAPQPWDGVKPLRAAGADLRYHPGLLTGAPGRMHHKLLVIDDSVVATGTTNFSEAAGESHETFVFLSGPGAEPWEMSSYAGAELARLFAAGTVEPPPLSPAATAEPA